MTAFLVAALPHNLIAPFEKVARLEGVMRDMPQVAIEPVHTFGPGFYARTIVIEEGTTLIGKEHATEHVFLLSEGTLGIEVDGLVTLMRGPVQIIAPAGVKRVGHAMTRCVVTNIHITTETDLVKLEATLIVPASLPAPEPMLGIA